MVLGWVILKRRKFVGGVRKRNKNESSAVVLSLSLVVGLALPCSATKFIQSENGSWRKKRLTNNVIIPFCGSICKIMNMSWSQLSKVLRNPNKKRKFVISLIYPTTYDWVACIPKIYSLDFTLARFCVC